MRKPVGELPRHQSYRRLFVWLVGIGGRGLVQHHRAFHYGQLEHSGRPIAYFDLDLTRRIVDSDWRTEALTRGVVVVSPAAPSTGLWFTDDSAVLVGPFLDAVAAGFPPTDGRFDLTGISNGGLSAFRAALDHPERFRSMALAPGAPPADATDEQFAALAGMRISQFVGGEDASWLAQSQAAHDRFTALGIDTALEVIAGDDHFLASLEPARVWDALGL